MKPIDKTFQSFVATTGVRRALVAEGDIRAEIEFQNDINAILARVEEGGQTLDFAGLAPPPRAVDTGSRRAGVRGGRPGLGWGPQGSRDPNTPDFVGADAHRV